MEQDKPVQHKKDINKDKEKRYEKNFIHTEKNFTITLDIQKPFEVQRTLKTLKINAFYINAKTLQTVARKLQLNVLKSVMSVIFKERKDS